MDRFGAGSWGILTLCSSICITAPLQNGETVAVGPRTIDLLAMDFVVLNPPLVLPADGIDLRCYLRAAEESLIRQALDHSGGTVSRAASLLHVGRTTLSEKVKRFGLVDCVKSSSHPR